MNDQLVVGRLQLQNNSAGASFYKFVPGNTVDDVTAFSFPKSEAVRIVAKHDPGT
jgi:hypothetical protein